MYSLPTSTTFAALTIASAASTEPIRPRVSTMPSASDAICRRNSIIPSRMNTVRAVVGMLLAGALAASCAKKEEEPPAVAALSVDVNRSDAAVGSPLDFTYRFAVAPDAPAFAENDTVFVHFVDTDGELMWTDDHEPPTPTTQWKPGETIEYTRTMFVPKFPYVGEARVVAGLYSVKTGQRVPLAGESAGMRSYRVATLNMRLQTDNLFVVFTDGWHDTEVADGGNLEWQWSRKEGKLSFRNPKRNVLFLLQLDQPVEAFPEPQRVEVQLRGQPVDTFTLPAGRRELRRIPLTAEQLGTAETVEITVVVDKTFVPASLPQTRSADPRELGVRVFPAYVEPK